MILPHPRLHEFPPDQDEASRSRPRFPASRGRKSPVSSFVFTRPRPTGKNNGRRNRNMTKPLPAEAGRLKDDRGLRTEVLRSRFARLKVLATVGFGALLVADVLHNRLVRHANAEGDRVSTDQHLAVPMLRGSFPCDHPNPTTEEPKGFA